MEQIMQQDILNKLKRRKIKRFWSRLVSVMTCIVVFCTTYALILPAITKETDVFCGLEEHAHTIACYPQQMNLVCEFAETELHIHTDACKAIADTDPTCMLEEVAVHHHTDACVSAEEKLLLCTLEESEGHVHTDTCQFQEEILTCTQTEMEGHIHSDACQRREEAILTCTVVETEGHAHTQECSKIETVLTCPLQENEEHTHDSSCYSETVTNICALAETEAHAHTDGCYQIAVSYGCGQEEAEGHIHVDACYTVTTGYNCGQEEAEGHSHTDTCYSIVYSCGLEETEGHTHTDSCYPTVFICGLEEVDHVHTEDCYHASSALVCGLEEDDAHTHNAECYNGSPVCQLEEHKHDLVCFADTTADLETATVWERTLPEHLTGDYTQDLLAVAASQLGYTESTRNYIVTEDNSLKGYTRYGAWYGDPYGDWCAMFVSFCLHYAGVEEIPLDSSCPNWIAALQEKEMYVSASEHVPGAGDIIFFDWNANGVSDHVGLVAEFLTAEEGKSATIRTIEGNSGDCVRYNTYAQDDPTIMGYGVLEAPEENILTTLTANIYTDATYLQLAQDDTVITVTGVLPKTAEVRAYAVQNQQDDLNALFVYDIEIFLEDGTVYVHNGDLLSVNFTSPQIHEICNEFASPEVYYIPEEGEPEQMDTVVENGNVSFETPHFSTYALVIPGDASKVRNQEELVNAWNTLSGGREGTIQLAADFQISTTLTLNNANAKITLDLNGHTLTHTGSANLFQVQNGTLTVGDSVEVEETVSSSGVVSVNNLDAHVATAQQQNGRVNLTYYVTESSIIDAAKGVTRETLYKHSVTGAGTILANASAPVFRISGGTLNIDSGMYYGGTSRAIYQTGGTANLAGGYICGFTDADYGGSVYSNAGTLNLSGVVLAANEADRGGAVYAANTEINITDGVISGNIATHTGGSGENASHYGGGGFYLDNSTTVMSGGYVTNNLARAQGYFDGGGGFLVCGDNGKISVSGGYITGNKAYSGGGIRTNWKNSVELTVSNGYVCANLATDAEGGGIALNMGGTGIVTGGYINNNATNANQHWGGGGLFGATGSNLYIRNVLITDNSAGGFGGGVGGCSTGRVYICVREGGAVYNNTAQGKNMSGDASAKSEDRVYAHNSEVFMNNGYQDYFCALNSIVEGGMLGGYSANWTGSADGAVVRAAKDDTLTAAYIMGLSAAPSQQGKAAAIAEAKVYINGNYSYTHGGGILCNGYMIIGETDHIEAGARIELEASKEFLGSDATTLKMLEGQFTFNVIDAQTGAVLSVASNDAEGNINFKERLPFFETGTFVYYIQEVPNNDGSVVFDSTVYRLTVDVTSNTSFFDEILVNGDRITIQRTQYLLDALTVHKRNGDEEWVLVSRNENPSNNDAGAIHLQLTSDTTFTNVQREDIDIEVQKRWEDDNAATRPTSVTVSLNRNGTSIERITLSGDNNWYHKWTDLPTVGEDGTTYVYTVTEDPVPGYVPEFETITNNMMTGYWIPATSIEVGERYAFISPDHRYALYMNDDKVNSPLTTNEKIAITTTAVTIDGVTYDHAIKDSVLDDRSIFRAENNGAHSNSRTILRSLGINGNSWLLAENNGGTYLKGCDSADYASGFDYNNGIYIQRQWDKNNEWRYLVFQDNKFNTVTTSSSNNALLYRYVYSGNITSNTLVRITNRSTGEVTYTLDITKISGINNDIRLAGAEFQLLDPETETPLRFVMTAPGAYEKAVESAANAVQTLVTNNEGKLVLRGLNAGDYVLRETKAPADHLPIADMMVMLGEPDASGHISLTLPLTIVDSAFTYELPETGGSGTALYTMAGLLLMLTSATYLMYIRKTRRREDL